MTTETNPSAKQPDAKQAETERIRERLSWLDPLCRNPDFQKYLEHIRKGVETNQRLALDLGRTSTDREAALHRYTVLLAEAEWPEKERTACIEHLRSADKPAPQPRSY